MADVYWPLLDAWINEMSSGWTSRAKVREHLEERLDRLRPEEERAKEWGQKMTREQWAHMNKRRRHG